ncbi:hypothetical protein CGLO_04225 [Colletotrichum gloeosporioides Cg-14]|uniref:Secreted protein n=1 Tax=Colletotrichum gloeosporioides (strain Cg-14) TaxID=1237896 RepID=T0KUN2_COLGC|nr:hypothetical protein CGLO_04225 [Colletotrichum gloeosporioides Cg-14]
MHLLFSALLAGPSSTTPWDRQGLSEKSETQERRISNNPTSPTSLRPSIIDLILTTQHLCEHQPTIRHLPSFTTTRSRISTGDDLYIPRPHSSLAVAN